MPAAKKKGIVQDPRMTAVLEAIASGDTSGLDPADLQAVMSTLGLKVVAKGIQEYRYSRTDKRREWLEPKELSEDELVVFKSLPEKIGQGPIVPGSDPRDLTQAEIDLWMDETLVEREVEDDLKGRHEARRATFFNVATFRSQGPCAECGGKGKQGRVECDNCEGSGRVEDPFAEGTFSSMVHGHKFVVGSQERGGDPDWNRLEEVVDPDVWDSITEVVATRQVDEDKLLDAVTSGKITLEQYQEVIPPKTTVRVLRVVALKEGEAI